MGPKKKVLRGGLQLLLDPKFGGMFLYSKITQDTSKKESAFPIDKKYMSVKRTGLAVIKRKEIETRVLEASKVKLTSDEEVYYNKFAALNSPLTDSSHSKAYSQ